MLNNDSYGEGKNYPVRFVVIFASSSMDFFHNDVKRGLQDDTRNLAIIESGNNKTSRFQANQISSNITFSAFDVIIIQGHFR